MPRDERAAALAELGISITNGVCLVNIPTLLAAMELEDTPDNRTMAMRACTIAVRQFAGHDVPVDLTPSSV